MKPDRLQSAPSSLSSIFARLAASGSFRRVSRAILVGAAILLALHLGWLAYFYFPRTEAGWREAMVRTPWFVVSGLGLLGISLSMVATMRRERVQRWLVWLAWGCSPVVLSGVPLTPGRMHALDVFHAVLVWGVAAAIALAARLSPARPASARPETVAVKSSSSSFSCSRGKEIPVRGRDVEERASDPVRQPGLEILAMTWALFGSFVWLAAAYLKNEPNNFYGGLAVGLVLLILCKRRFRLPDFGVMTINTLILILVGLPAVDLATRPTSRLDGRLALSNQYYSYRAAKQNPAAFRNWWNNYLQQWNLMGRDIFVPDPTGALPLRLKPNAKGFLFESPIHINSRGFRGPEWREERGDTYRIVTLGESTTFGCTLKREDRPWPEVLEQLIRERLGNLRPVEVINAGVPAYNLQHNLTRLTTEILPLKPDLIISYHGANGFYLLDAALPKPFGALPPAYQRRPVKLLADCEQGLKMRRYRRRLDPQRLLDPAGFSNPLTTPYAEAYRELIRVAHTNGIRLVLANYAMAVNRTSDSDVVEFYRTASPSIHWQIRANAVHTEMVKQLAAQHPEVRFVDTHPNLDGDTEKFIDMGHFTQAGRDQMAETFFAGLKSLLESELSRPASAGVK